jgi:hypothetical protein
MPTHSSADKLVRRSKALHDAKARLRASLAAIAARSVQNRAGSPAGGQGAVSRPR